MSHKKPTDNSEFSSEIATECRNPDKFGERVKAARIQRGFSQAELARKIGVSATTIQNYESGQFPKGELAVQLATHLECTLDWLLAGKGAAPFNEVNDTLPLNNDQGCPNCARLIAENRELSAENRQLWRENGDLRVEVAELKARAAPQHEQPEKARKSA